jgi:hypothetical protein
MSHQMREIGTDLARRGGWDLMAMVLTYVSSSLTSIGPYCVDRLDQDWDGIGDWVAQLGTVLCAKCRRRGTYHRLINKVEDGWYEWKRFLYHAHGEPPVFAEPKFYCPVCKRQLSEWVTAYGDKVVTAAMRGKNQTTTAEVRRIGSELGRLGGLDLMVMTAAYVGMQLPKQASYTVSDLDWDWNGIGEWQR